jgi:hypothetical protein
VETSPRKTLAAARMLISKLFFIAPSYLASVVVAQNYGATRYSCRRHIISFRFHSSPVVLDWQRLAARSLVVSASKA